MLLLVSSGVGLWLLGVEPLAVCYGKGDVGACATFEFADPDRVSILWIQERIEAIQRAMPATA